VLWLDAGDIDGNGTPDAKQAKAPCHTGAAVAAWRDRSGAGLCAAQPQATAQPTFVAAALGGQPAVRFDGGDHLNLGKAPTLGFKRSAPFTIVAVYNATASQLGTLIARGGGKSAQRAYQFYVTNTNLGGIAHGSMREARRATGPGVAYQVCKGRKCALMLNGEMLAQFRSGRGTSAVDTLVGARRKTADNQGAYYALKGDIAELLVYRRALSEKEQVTLGQHLGAKYGIEVVGSPAEAIAKLVAEGKALGAAEKLLRLAHSNALRADLPDVAAALLAHADPFVRGTAEWALAMKVGGDNNAQETTWPSEDPPAWFKAWAALPPARRLEADHVRQAVARGIHRNGNKLLADVEAMCQRADRMATDFALPADQVATLRKTRDALAARVKAAAAPAGLAAHRALWLTARRAMHAIAMANPAVDFDKLVFVKQFSPHTVRNITRSYQWKHKPGGDICVLTGLRPDGQVRGLIGQRLGRGFAWGLDLWWDADRVVFGYAPQPVWPPAVNTTHYGTEGRNVFELRKTHPPMHIYEIGIDGTRLRQITRHPYWNDFEPTYCANGDIVFASDRCARSAECGSETYDHMNPNLYIASPDGATVRQLTDNKDIDRYPHSLADGRIAYTHWEYQERHFMEVHSLWTVRPDGTMSDALFKHHMRAPCALRDTRSVPGSARLVSIATGHHTFAYGPVVLLDPQQGTNNDAGIAIVTPGVRVQEGRMAGTPVPGGGVPDRGGLYHTPWALSEHCFLAAYAYARPQCTAPAGVDSNGFGIYLIDTYGNRELLHRDPLLSCVFPIPLRKRPRPPILPDARTEDQRVATCYLPDVYDGMTGVPRGTVKYIRVSQHVGWPLDPKRGAMHYIPGSAGGGRIDFTSWSPVRVIGEVPVEADGSAHFTVPADAAIYFQALDARHMEIVRMRSMVSLKAGETRGCRGCHESQARAPEQPLRTPLALRHGPVTPTPPPWGAHKMLGYESIVQPILDRHCTRCHGQAPDNDGLDLSATRTTRGLFRSYRTLFGERPGQKKRGRRFVSVANRFDGAQVTLPKQFGSHKSPLIRTLLTDDLHKKEVKLSGADWYALVTWIDANAPYHDVFFNKRPADGGKMRRDVRPTFPPFPPPAKPPAKSVAAQR